MMEINLLPRASLWIEYRRLFLFLGVIIMTAMMGCGVVLYLNTLHQESVINEELSKLKQETDTAQTLLVTSPSNQVYAELLAKIDLISGSEYDWTYLLDLVTGQLPNKAVLSSVTVNKQSNQMLLHGRVQLLSDIATYMDALRRNGNVKNVTATSISNGSGGAGYTFDITVTLQPKGPTQGVKSNTTPAAGSAGKQ